MLAAVTVCLGSGAIAAWNAVHASASTIQVAAGVRPNF
jgi:hypothetical protein